MIIIKFGGTSVGDAGHLRTAIDVVEAARERQPVVVVSALSGVTNQLVEATQVAARGELDKLGPVISSIRERHQAIAFELVQQKSDYLESFLSQVDRHIQQMTEILRGICLVGEVTPRAKDKIVSIGEKLSSVLFSYTLRLTTLPGVAIDSEEVVVTDENYGQAEPLMIETTAAAERVIRPELDRRHIPVMGGFIGRSLSGATTTLGRGGSDYTAAIVGAALRADEVQIWTDVDGMLTCDPRIVPSAQMIDLISYEEAAELAYFGAKVLHPKTITPAVDLGVPIRVLNTHNPSSPGTLITAEGDRSRRGARSIALKRDITLVHIVSNKMLGAHGFLARIFEVFNRYSVSVDLITTSEVSVTLSIDSDEPLEKVIGELEGVATVRIAPNQTIVAVVGRDLLDDPAVASRIFEALGGRKTSMISYGLTRLNLSVVLDEVDPNEAVRSLHQALFGS